MRKALFFYWWFLSFAYGAPAASVRFFNGEFSEGKTEIGARGVTVTPKGGGPTEVDLSNVLSVNFHKNAQSLDSVAPGVVLTNGTAIADKSVLPLVEPTLAVGIEKWKVSSNAIAWVIFAKTPRAKFASAPAGQTGALLPNGDFFPGALTSVLKEKVSISSPLFGVQTLSKAQVAGFVFRDLKIAPAVRFEILTIQGTRFLVDGIQFESTGVSLRDSILGSVRIKSDDIAAIRAASGRFLPLVEQKPLSINPSAGMDAAAAVSVQKPAEEIEEGPAQVLTTAGNAAVSYSVAPGFGIFTSGVAIPNNAPPGVRLVFAVYGDGRLLFHTPPLGSSDRATPIRINIGNVRTLTLRVEPAGGAGGLVGEWSDPMLLR